MTTRKKQSAAIKAQVAIEAIKEAETLSELPSVLMYIHK